jgi:hypothetical protein
LITTSESRTATQPVDGVHPHDQPIVHGQLYTRDCAGNDDDTHPLEVQRHAGRGA